MFTLTIETGNAAFHGENDDDDGQERTEIARILHELADRIDDGSEAGGRLSDANGNAVGRWEISTEG